MLPVTGRGRGGWAKLSFGNGEFPKRLKPSDSFKGILLLGVLLKKLSVDFLFIKPFNFFLYRTPMSLLGLSDTRGWITILARNHDPLWHRGEDLPIPSQPGDLLESAANNRPSTRNDDGPFLCSRCPLFGARHSELLFKSRTRGPCVPAVEASPSKVSFALSRFRIFFLAATHPLAHE